MPSRNSLTPQEFILFQMFHEKVKHEQIRTLIFYGNVCKVCFSKGRLKKCSACKTVPYCSKEHQYKDWPIHKRICKALRVANENIVCEENATFKQFNEYRNKLKVHLRKALKEEKVEKPITEELFKFPWVCAMCYSKDNLNFECECTAVVYCSLEHMQEDKGHKVHCNALQLAKLCDSVIFENGFYREMKIHAIRQTSGRQNFPSDMIGLWYLAQNTVVSEENMYEMMPFVLFSSIHSMGATILYVLKRLSWLRNGMYIKKPLFTHRQRHFRNVARMLPFYTLDNKHTMVVHFIAVDYNDVRISWSSIASLLFQWLQNIDLIEVELVGGDLWKYKTIDNWARLLSNISIHHHDTQYKHAVKHLMQPDLIVLNDYYRSNESQGVNEFDDLNSQEALFNHANVPVIVTSIEESMLTEFVNKLKLIDAVKVKVDVQKNPFAAGRPFRIWNEVHMSTYYLNEYISVLTRE